MVKTKTMNISFVIPGFTIIGIINLTLLLYKAIILIHFVEVLVANLVF